ncbi:hypothetical protein ASC95_10050 [Pelomonas sp. Root1217]|uniref:DUF1579 family protein n=1 Tax=Pelomonas sp. Root1217 TaxID=1736430 RepID=UPI0007098DED|nr:DUF1579 family protein [Pelomonas sp. Root1217]KQV53097.1 hypothetical protein ASC95_10050 [Pelomonas sp. Root1217]
MAANRMSKFDVFIGTWNTSGEVLETDAGPASTLTATDTYRWLPGRHFIVHEVDARFDGKPTRSMEVMGFDTSKQQHFARSFDDQGVAEAYVVELHGRRWTISGKTARFNGGFDAGRNRLTGFWELKGRRGRWQPWIKLELARA